MEFRIIAQTIAGAYIGMTVKKENLPRMKHLIRPTITLLVGLIVTNFLVGILIYLVSPLDILTSFLAGIPGGVSDTPLIAADLGADAAKVTVLQFVRLISGISMVPLLVKYDSKETGGTGEKPKLVIKKPSSIKNRKLWVSLILAFIAGTAGRMMGVPAGTLIFAMLCIVILKMASYEVTFPIWFKRMAQLFSGAYIGSRFGYQDFVELKYLAIPALILVVLNMFSCFLMGNILAKKYKLPLSQAILSSSPAGASDMALIASDLGVSGSDVAMIQILRLIGAISIFPQVFYMITKVFF
ncbi:AbrB family transcriptional regulator [Proteiniclasticum sp. SCR006]|uniref:AbrB family transcriptional regulator n=2 Tax=Proteiniclasticum aestuarii TaxID=2817862 RepID=A0A939HEH6_9CLOT|nr:AbrB family transcriptional regulator [Proteiniclasticum aestuarii]